MPQHLKLLVFFMFTAGAALAQQPQEVLSGVPARPTQEEESPAFRQKSSIFLKLPFFDDFSYRRSYPADSLWEDKNVYVNQTYGIAPPTLGVATFDGLDRYGWPYDITSLKTDSTDVLTSRGIDLSNTRDSVYLSFFYQAGGHGEKPESSDSLSLYFYSPLNDEWTWAWGERGGISTTTFHLGMVPVAGAAFLQEGFKFRFVAHGARAGAFDVWNLDYVLLNDQRNFNSTPYIRKDPAFTRPFPSLLKDYEAMPWFHYSPTVAQVLNKQNLILYYQRNARSNPPSLADRYSLNLGVYRVTHNGIALAQDNQGDAQIDNSHTYFVETAYSYPLKNFIIPAVPTAPFSIKAFHTYNGLADMGPNDTIYRDQKFSNYYAYDDGSAERAYHVNDNRDGVILTKFDIVQADVVRGAYFYFLPAEFDAVDQKFTIVIYENINGLPGNLMYESDSVYTAQYSSHNFYLPYALDDSNGVQVPASGFFIGLRQHSRGPLPLGFDMNNTGLTTIFYGEPGRLFQSFQSGSIMIRPFMRSLPADISTPEHKMAGTSWKLYPNPSNGRLFLEGLEENESLHYQLLDLTGRIVEQGTAGRDLQLGSAVKDGLYILRLSSTKSAKSHTLKIMIRK